MWAREPDETRIRAPDSGQRVVLANALHISPDVPAKWERRLKRRGSPPPIYRGGCMWSGNTVTCRNPFAPGLQAVEGG